MRFQIFGLLFTYNEPQKRIYTQDSVWECVKSYGPVSMYRPLSYKLYWQNRASAPVIGNESMVKLTKVTAWLN